jgi:tetratricopeptide (TPR) repeat protein
VGLLQRALVIREHAFGRRHYQTGIVLNNLGLAQIALARYPEAKRTLERALAVSLETRGPDHPQTAFALGRLGDLHRLTGDLPAAEAAYVRALAGGGTPSESEDVYFVPNLRGWGRLLIRLGRLEEAETALTRALGLVEAASPSSNEIAPTLTAMAELRLRQHPAEQAHGLLERALGLSRTDPFTRVEVLVLLGDARAAQGAGRDAEEAYRRARDLAARLYPAEHPERSRAERALASPTARSAS